MSRLAYYSFLAQARGEHLHHYKKLSLKEMKNLSHFQKVLRKKARAYPLIEFKNVKGVINLEHLS